MSKFRNLAVFCAAMGLATVAYAEDKNTQTPPADQTPAVTAQAPAETPAAAPADTTVAKDTKDADSKSMVKEKKHKKAKKAVKKHKKAKKAAKKANKAEENKSEVMEAPVAADQTTPPASK